VLGGGAEARGCESSHCLRLNLVSTNDAVTKYISFVHAIKTLSLY
jgi:hypothetical protein